MTPRPRSAVASAQIAPAHAAPSAITIALPLDALSGLTVQAPPPALVSRVNAHHVGLESDELVRVLRAMRGDQRFAEHVIVRGKSFRAAPPDAIIAYLRAAPSTTADDVEADDAVDDELLRAAGYERAPASGSRSRTGRAKR